MIKMKKIFLAIVFLCVLVNFSITDSLAKNEISSQNPISNIKRDAQIKQIILNGTSDEVKQLISNDFDINKNYGCSSVINKAIQSLFWSKNEKSTPEEAIEKINIVIDAGADINLEICNMTPLAMAVTLPQQIKEEGMKYEKVIDNNIDSSPDICSVNGVSKPCKETTAADRMKMKAEIRKIFAEEQEKLEPYIIRIVDILVNKGANINEKSHGVAPLHFAANIQVKESYQVLKHLLEKGANPNVTDMQGNTPLFVANFADNKSVIDMLVSFGADTTIKNNKGLLYNQFKTGELKEFYK